MTIILAVNVFLGKKKPSNLFNNYSLWPHILKAEFYELLDHGMTPSGPKLTYKLGLIEGFGAKMTIILALNVFLWQSKHTNVMNNCSL